MTHVTLFIPGPSEVREDILHAQTAPMIGHRSDACNALSMAAYYARSGNTAGAQRKAAQALAALRRLEGAA